MMILPEELKKILDNNTVASIDLTDSSYEVVAGHDTKIVDVTKLIIDLNRLFKGFTLAAVGNNKIPVAGDKISATEIKRIQIANLTKNEIRERVKEMTNARNRMD